MILGLVTIAATILSKAEKKKQQEEALNNILSAGAVSSAASTAALMNGVQNVIDGIQKEKAQASNITAVETRGIPHFNPFSVAEQEGPKIYDTPITEQKIPEPLIFPRVDQEPIILSFPHEEPVNKDIAKGKIKATKENFLNKAKEIDEKFGDKFNPKMK